MHEYENPIYSRVIHHLFFGFALAPFILGAGMMLANLPKFVPHFG